MSWTQALRTIVKNCYKQHGREDLLYAFEDQQVTTAQGIAHLVPSQTVVQTINNPDGTVSLIQVHFLCCLVICTLKWHFYISKSYFFLQFNPLSLYFLYFVTASLRLAQDTQLPLWRTPQSCLV